MKTNTIKEQVITSIEKFIQNNVEYYNGFIPMNALEYTIYGIGYFYCSPYHSKAYSDRVAFEFIKKKYGITRVRDLSFECYTKLTKNIHGNRNIVIVKNLIN